MRVVGLTGSIGMGKSTAGRALKKLGVPVLESDRIVHQALGPGGTAVEQVRDLFPQVMECGRINRFQLGALVFADLLALKRLEQILHPLVWRAQRSFLIRMSRYRYRMAVLDIPLLFETGADGRFDATVVVAAPEFIQRARVLARPGMTEGKFRDVLKRQMPSGQKCRLADFVVPTGLGRRYALRKLIRMKRQLLAKPACHWPPTAYHSQAHTNARNRHRYGDHRL